MAGKDQITPGWRKGEDEDKLYGRRDPFAEPPEDKDAPKRKVIEGKGTVHTKVPYEKIHGEPLMPKRGRQPRRGATTSKKTSKKSKGRKKG